MGVGIKQNQHNQRGGEVELRLKTWPNMVFFTVFSTNQAQKNQHWNKNLGHRLGSEVPGVFRLKKILWTKVKQHMDMQ